MLTLDVRNIGTEASPIKRYGFVLWRHGAATIIAEASGKTVCVKSAQCTVELPIDHNTYGNLWGFVYPHDTRPVMDRIYADIIGVHLLCGLGGCEFVSQRSSGEFLFKTSFPEYVLPLVGFGESITEVQS